jgi:Mg2+-importing ATPase
VQRPRPAPAATTRPPVGRAAGTDVADAAAAPTAEVLGSLGTSERGLTSAEAAARRESVGPNVLAVRSLSWPTVLLRQLRSPLLVLLGVTAVASAFLRQPAEALVIAVILGASVGLSFVNEFRAERATQALRHQLRDLCWVWRDGQPVELDVVDLVPGDVLDLRMGEVVPADARLLEATGLQCEESALTGESLPVDKQVEPVAPGSDLSGLASAVLMGTTVHAGSGRAVVVATGRSTRFGRIAAALSAAEPPTQFEIGLRRFSALLLRVAIALTVGIFVINVALHRPVLDALLFSLAIAVGISPQLLPAVVSTSLASGAHRLARQRVLVRRLVAIEDLGELETLFTDKTGTLTLGEISFMRCLDATGRSSSEPLALALACTDTDVVDGRAVGGPALDLALWTSPATLTARARVAALQRSDVVPFDHTRQLMSVVVQPAEGPRLVTKGAPEQVLARCATVPDAVRRALATEFAAGHRVLALATRDLPAGRRTATPADEVDLHLEALLVFLDPVKDTAAAALADLARLDVRVKVLTGDNPVVAASLWHDLGRPAPAVLTGSAVDAVDDDQLADLVERTDVFARVTPEQKARIVGVHRRRGRGVGFLGDGVNDAPALHAADIGISVDTGADVAKDAADVILLDKDLAVLAGGVVGGRRIFANTLKYAQMGTSSNFGNMFSAAGASAFLSFLPMLPSQILLNNLLYDASQLAIPTDEVDADVLARPARWDVDFIRRFMLVFGPVSSLFDVLTFALLLGVFHAGPPLFRTGWFVESLATQTLIIFLIRTKRVPFWRSRPSLPLVLAALAVVAVGVVVPLTPAGSALGFVPLPGSFYAVLGVLLLAYLLLVEVTKIVFFRAAPAAAEGRRRPRDASHRVHRLAGRFHVGAA